MPEDWIFSVAADQLTLTPDNPVDARLRVPYGYISSIKVADSVDTGIPFCAHVILRLPFRYGTSPDELGDIWIYRRSNNFASTARLPSLAQVGRAGMPVCGLRAKSSGKC